jgi:hypothetical protein
MNGGPENAGTWSVVEDRIKSRLRNIPSELMTSAWWGCLRERYNDVAASLSENAAQLRCTEELLDCVVGRLYGLTPEERQLLRATRPGRDPIHVLKAKLTGLDNAQPTEATDE